MGSPVHAAQALADVQACLTDAENWLNALADDQKSVADSILAIRFQLKSARAYAKHLAAIVTGDPA